jgi:hypothetical protein
MIKRFQRAMLLIGALCFSSALMAASQEKPVSSWSSDHIKAAQTTIEAVKDIRSWTGARPAPVGELRYDETRAFDMQLHESLKARLSPVNVRVERAFARDRIPARMGQWLRHIEKTGGDVRTCVVDDGGKSFLALLSMALGIIKKADKWLLYRPVSNYDGTIIVESNKSNVMNVIFNERGTVGGCPKGTQQYSS